MNISQAASYGSGSAETAPPRQHLGEIEHRVDTLAKQSSDLAARLENLAERLLGQAPANITGSKNGVVPVSSEPPAVIRIEGGCELTSFQLSRIDVALNRLERL